MGCSPWSSSLLGAQDVSSLAGRGWHWLLDDECVWLRGGAHLSLVWAVAVAVAVAVDVCAGSVCVRCAGCVYVICCVVVGLVRMSRVRHSVCVA